MKTKREYVEPRLSDAAIHELRTVLRGKLLEPGADDYETARKVWNAGIDRRPGLIVQCAGTADVIHSVNFARSNNLLVSVRGGGHDIAGNAVCDGGVMIDLSRMKGLHVDPASRTVHAEAGLTWGEFDHETQTFGLATTGGKVSSTGISGLTLGGGYGWLMRKYGLVIDNLLSVDMVMADGRFLTASPTENEDLFWGIRGGGGNFGIVTSFQFRLHQVGPTVLGGLALYPLDSAKELLCYFREFMASAPDELMAFVAVKTAPPAPFVSKDLHGKLVVILAVCYAGEIGEGQQVLAPLRKFASPLAERIGPMPYTRVQRLLDAAGAFGYQVCVKSDHLGDLNDSVIDTFVNHAVEMTSPFSVAFIIPLGGAVSHVGDSDTAFSHRNAPYDYSVYSLWTDQEDSERHVRWTEDFGKAMLPFSIGVYVNEMGDEGEERLRSAYSPANFARLITLKNKYDPENFFSLNHNIKPTT